LQIEVPRVKFIDLNTKNSATETQNIIQRIALARKIQRQRFKDNDLVNTFTNSEITSQNIEQLCPLDEPSKQLLKEAMSKFHLSARSYHRLIKVARTIADLAQAENIKIEHLAEALQFRMP